MNFVSEIFQTWYIFSRNSAYIVNSLPLLSTAKTSEVQVGKVRTSKSYIDILVHSYRLD